MTALMIDTGVRWRFHSTCPTDWAAQIERCGAGFFHSPAGLAASGGHGDPFFGELVDGDGTLLGIAAGVQHRCRIPPLPKHAHLPAPPALVTGVGLPRKLAIEALVERASGEGWTDLNVDSLEADGEVAQGGGGTALPPRQEYDIPLSGTAADLAGRLSSGHRRRLPKNGEWTLRTLSGPDARDLLVEVTGSARRRAVNRRGVSYDVTLPPPEAFREDPFWGLTTYAAMAGDVPLTAAMVGWAGKRAYYVSGGSTPDGYARNASTWLHLQIAGAFQSAGFTHYCLGGAPASALDPNDPSNGLHRFKTGFGAVVRSCVGARWVFGTEHEAGHRVTRWLRDLVRAKEPA